MPSLISVWSCVLLVVATGVSLSGADLSASTWLASRGAPACPSKAGVRSSRSDLVELGGISASISTQSVRDEAGGCEQSASLWLTNGEVSHQFELSDAGSNTFSIVDFSPDASTILLYREKTYSLPGEDAAPQVALLPITGGAIQWLPVSQVMGWKNCSGVAEPEGFQGSRRLVFHVAPAAGLAGPVPACVDKVKLLALDLDAKKVIEMPSAVNLRRNGKKVAGPVLSCQSDPDVSGACYSIKGRVGLGANGVSMRLWQVDTGKWMDLGEGMLPDELGAQVTPRTWVFADMIVCPLRGGAAKLRPRVCIESAGNYRTQAAVTKLAAKAPVSSGTTESGTSH